MAGNSVYPWKTLIKVADMTSRPEDQMLELGWLATSAAAERDDFLPVYRKLKKDGLTIFDEWGYLTPGLEWRTDRAICQPTTECLFALKLLQSTCQAAIHAGHLGLLSVSEAAFVKSMVELKNADYPFHDPGPVCIYSPRIPSQYSRKAWLSALPVLVPLRYHPRLRRLSVDPALLLRIGYHMLVNEWSSNGPRRAMTAESLAIFGLGALGLFPRLRCVVCFRHSLPGTTRCRVHWQGGPTRFSNNGLHSRTVSSARLGNRVMEKLEWRPDMYINPAGIAVHSEERTVAGILWGKEVGFHTFKFEQVQKGLAKGRFPRVQTVLGPRFGSLNSSRALALLRQKIDPNEWSVSSWYIRLHAAEQWLEAAAVLSPGRRQSKVAPQTLELVKRSRTLIQQGLSQKEVAAQLKIKPPYLSRLLKRFPTA